MIGRQKSGLRTLHRRKTHYESRGPVPGEIFMNPRLEKRISSAWRPEFRQKVNFFRRSFSSKPRPNLTLSARPAISRRSRHIWTGPGGQSGTKNQKMKMPRFAGSHLFLKVSQKQHEALKRSCKFWVRHHIIIVARKTTLFSA